jgi:hypothetical protein
MKVIKDMKVTKVLKIETRAANHLILGKRVVRIRFAPCTVQPTSSHDSDLVTVMALVDCLLRAGCGTNGQPNFNIFKLSLDS